MSKLTKVLFLFVFVFLSMTAEAYIPKFWQIISRTAESHGRGIYLIEQDVVFLHNQEPQVVHESWVIQDEKNMRLKVVGRKNLKGKINFTYVYNNSKRYFIDSQGIKKVSANSDNWFEKYFHFRFSKNIKPILSANNIIPPEAMKRPSKIYREDKIDYSPESFTRLSRVGGVVTYGIGKPTPANSQKLLPGIWIDQDHFNVRKIRLNSGLSVKANKFNRYERGLWLPRKREVSWSDQNVLINVIKVKPLAKTRRIRERLSHKSLDFAKSPELALKLPDDKVIVEFYKRLR